MIKLPFSGIKGDTNSKPIFVQVPCMETWTEDGNPEKAMACPVLAEIRPWYKLAKQTGDDELKKQADRYWKKRTYISQGFVRETFPGLEEETPENPIRRFVLGPQLYNVLKAALIDPEMDSMPTDYDAGVDLVINVTAKGEYNDYTASKFSRRESSLTNVEREAIDTFGLKNLADFLPKRPGPAELTAIMEMFEASVDGQAYDQERWGQYYRPAGLRDEDGDARPASKAEQSPRARVVDETTEADTAVVAPKATSKAIPDVMKLINERKAAAAAALNQ
jgi:hypothetical protein